jgi:hypothetical protein
MAATAIFRNSSGCYKMSNYYLILMKSSTKTKKPMLKLKLTTAEGTPIFKMAAAAMLEIFKCELLHEELPPDFDENWQTD